jgi:hypothetical protein
MSTPPQLLSNSGTLTITASAGKAIIPNPTGATFLSFEEYFTGTAPSTCSITIQGGMKGGTLDTAASTNTTVAASIVVVTFTKPYGGFTVTASWTGGDSTTAFVCNWVVGLK